MLAGLQSQGLQIQPGIQNSQGQILPGQIQMNSIRLNSILRVQVLKAQALQAQVPQAGTLPPQLSQAGILRAQILQAQILQAQILHAQIRRTQNRNSQLSPWAGQSRFQILSLIAVSDHFPAGPQSVRGTRVALDPSGRHGRRSGNRPSRNRPTSSSAAACARRGLWAGEQLIGRPRRLS
jgi:hypothetical protein